jgi:hypothetical protein
MHQPSVTRRRMRVLLALLILVAACDSTAKPIETQPVGVDPTSPPTIAAASASPAAITPAPSSGVAPSPGPTPFVVWLPPGSPLPPTMLPEAPVLTEPPDDEPLIATTTGNVRATRLVVPALGIDLAVMKGNTDYPYCNVAQYLPPPDFVHPGQPGTTYLYAHARRGMMLPLLTRSKINDGASMIGMKVYLYTADEKLHLYKINIVKRHVRDFSLAYNLDPGQHRLIMQTSEGPNKTYAKLQVAAKPVGVYLASAEDALRTPHPKICS